MTTAREQLYIEFCDLLLKQCTEQSKQELSNLINSYRIQKKSGGTDPSGLTARELLKQKITEYWLDTSPDVKEKMLVTMNTFRMQFKKKPTTAVQKTKSSQKNQKSDLFSRITAKKNERKSKNRKGQKQNLEPTVTLTETQSKTVGKVKKSSVEKILTTKPTARNPLSSPTSQFEPGELSPLQRNGELSPLQRNKDQQPVSMQIAGGPRKRKVQRQECPKCKSMGVSYTQSYTGSSYFSCVYCGWQSLSKDEMENSTAELASRLLGDSTEK